MCHCNSLCVRNHLCQTVDIDSNSHLKPFLMIQVEMQRLQSGRWNLEKESVFYRPHGNNYEFYKNVPSTAYLGGLTRKPRQTFGTNLGWKLISITIYTWWIWWETLFNLCWPKMLSRGILMICAQINVLTNMKFSIGRTNFVQAQRSSLTT